MPDHYKYLPISTDDAGWGLSVLNTGATHIPPGMAYPSAGHPAHHYFKWSKGRVLQEHQVIYITKGELMVFPLFYLGLFGDQTRMRWLNL